MNARLADAVAEVTEDGSTTHLALLDVSGRIVAVNEAWNRFVRANDGDPARVGPGVDYLSICTGVPGPDGEDGQRVALAIRRALAGEPERVAAVYPCHGPDDRRWFEVRVRPVGRDGVLVQHRPTTERVLLEQLRQTLATLGAATPGGDELADLADALAADESVVRDALPRLGGLRDALERPPGRDLTTAGALVDAAVAARPDLAPPVAVHDDDGVVEADARLLGMVLGELLRNVRQHAGGTAVVRLVEFDGGGLQVLVDDDGPGIPPARRHDVTTPRLGDAVGGGLGLGLPIARALAHHHGGWLLVEESPSGGCRIHVEL